MPLQLPQRASTQPTVQCTRLNALALHGRDWHGRQDGACSHHGELQPLPADVQPEIVTMRLMELVDKSNGYLKRLREVAAPVAEGRTTRGRGRPRTN
eukprot:355612-Chlamydomonas_euryale.AAC.2